MSLRQADELRQITWILEKELKSDLNSNEDHKKLLELVSSVSERNEDELVYYAL